MTSATATPLHHRPALARTSEAAARGHQWRWLLAGLTLAFSIPFALTDLTSIDRDLYYGIYIVGVFGFVAAWLARGVGSPRAVLARHWRGGVALGLVFAAVMVAIVRNEPASARPEGLDFAAAIAWRGVLYGLADGVLLSAFPILAVFAAFAGGQALDRRRGKFAVGALALGISLLFTAVYHLGYSDFRGEKLRKPLVGDLVWSVPTLVTLSPLGAPIAHAGLHVGAVVHSYETDVFLPPHAAGLDPAPLQLLLEQAVTGPDRLAPGATAFVSTPAGSWSGAAGVANLATGALMTPDARMRLESVSKIYTATIIHQLAEEGELQLGDTLEKWLPGVFPYGRQVTVAQLLTHTSGIVDDNVFVSRFDHYLSLIEDPKLRAEVREVAALQTANPALEFSTGLLVRIAAALPPLFPPGSEYHYSNTGFLVLGMVASRVTGKSMATLYRERIFDPLGLDQTAWDPQGPIDGPHARAYRRNPDGTQTDATDWHGGKGADGAVVSNAVETARFLTALMRGELLGRPQLDAMKAYGFWGGGDQTGCAGPAFGHSGAGAAFKTNVWVSGDGSRVAVLLLNGRRDDATDTRAGTTMATLYCAAGEKDR